jgi:hypothetical protein
MARESSLDAVMAGMVTSGGKYGNTALQALNPVWYAQSKIKRREYDAALEICTALLERNPYDQVGSSSQAQHAGFNTRGAECVDWRRATCRPYGI